MWNQNHNSTYKIIEIMVNFAWSNQHQNKNKTNNVWLFKKQKKNMAWARAIFSICFSIVVVDKLPYAFDASFNFLRLRGTKKKQIEERNKTEQIR